MADLLFVIMICIDIIVSVEPPYLVTYVGSTTQTSDAEKLASWYVVCNLNIFCEILICID